ncbi:MAG: T9SS type A sorting domain-containing protein [Bacteroidota bacterium]
MKQLYLVLFFLCIAAGHAQSSRTGTDIDGFDLYPNPVTHGKVYIKTTEDAPKKVHIFNVFGTPVLQTTLLGSELNLSELDAGVYVIRVFQRDKVATRKLIVK